MRCSAIPAVSTIYSLLNPRIPSLLLNLPLLPPSLSLSLFAAPYYDVLPPAPAPASASPHSSSSISLPVIIAISVGGVLLLFLIIVVISLYCCRAALLKRIGASKVNMAKAKGENRGNLARGGASSISVAGGEKKCEYGFERRAMKA